MLGDYPVGTQVVYTATDHQEGSLVSRIPDKESGVVIAHEEILLFVKFPSLPHPIHLLTSCVDYAETQEDLCVESIQCLHCPKEWVAVYPKTAVYLECPACGNRTPALGGLV
jgi:hypothetical protein